MNQKIEIKKIKVNNGKELIAKAKEYKNSGGEWKLREKYWESPDGREEDDKNSWGWGIIISNGEKEVNIYSTEGNLSGVAPNNEIEAREELERLFPKAKFAPLHFDRQEGTHHKEVKQGNETYNLYRYLVAENSWHLKQILHQYVRDNETKIYQSANPHFSGWVEIVDGKDNNIYLYVGEKNASGGREIKIGITKGEFEKCGGKGYDASEMLSMNWNLFTITRPRTPVEEKDYYYQALSTNGDYWKTLHRNFEKTCRFMLEEARRLYEKRKSFLAQEPDSEIRNKELASTDQIIIDIDGKLEEMKKNHPDWYNNYNKICSDCGNRMCCHHWGNCGKSKNQSESESPFHNLLIENDSQTPILPPSTPKNTQISPTDKNQLLQYFLTYHITKIILENGKLVVKYDNSNLSQKVNNSELEKFKGLIQNFPNHEISLSDLQKTNSNSQNSTKNPNNHHLAIGLAIGAGAVALVSGVIYFWNRKKKRA